MGTEQRAADLKDPARWQSLMDLWANEWGIGCEYPCCARRRAYEGSE